MIHAVSKRQNGNDQFCLFLFAHMNNKTHVRETENVLDDIILVDTPFKQA